MRYSKLFGRTRFDAPHDAESVNSKFLIQAGFIEKQSAGIYNFLPLGLRVLNKINNIIREEMNAFGGQEILMPVLHLRSVWKDTGRDESMDEVLYRTEGTGDQEYVLGPSHEEIVTPLVKKFVKSYKDLPVAVYQIQTKFRDEPRAKSGLLRGREFGMKDMYSFHLTDEDLDKYYEEMKKAYMNVYTRCGLKAYIIEASGGAFTDKFSHEFSIETPAGEDTIVLCDKCGTAQNSEVAKDVKCPGCGGDFRRLKAVEAGNIFKLGKKFSEAVGLKVADKTGKEVVVTMGCYGIGNTRLVGTIVEASHDENGIIWPKSVAPYLVHLISLGADEEVAKSADKIYENLLKDGVEVLYDDRDESAGKKFKDSDLIGIPYRVVISKKTLEQDSVELKERSGNEARLVKIKDLAKELS